MPQRTKAIEAFQQDPPTTVFILTLRSAACGINLTAASHVFLLEPCLNPAVEAQAIGRAWGMGQTRSVAVKRLYVKVSSRRWPDCTCLLAWTMPICGCSASPCVLVAVH